MCLPETRANACSGSPEQFMAAIVLLPKFGRPCRRDGPEGKLRPLVPVGDT